MYFESSFIYIIIDNDGIEFIMIGYSVVIVIVMFIVMMKKFVRKFEWLIIGYRVRDRVGNGN